MRRWPTRPGCTSKLSWPATWPRSPDAPTRRTYAACTAGPSKTATSAPTRPADSRAFASPAPSPVQSTPTTSGRRWTRPPRRCGVWLLLMAMQGLRCIEVAALRPQDVTVTDTGGVLFLRECKGGGTASMPAHASIIAALALLPQRDGLWWECSRQHVSRQVSVYLRSLGIDATGHRLRHYAGTSWLRASGHDLLTTARLLRHESVKTTQIYAELDPRRPAEVLGLTHAPGRSTLRAV